MVRKKKICPTGVAEIQNLREEQSCLLTNHVNVRSTGERNTGLD